MEFFIGQIIMFGGNFAIRSFALAQGQLLAISQNSALFSILGTTYGGDGRTTFGLPDLRGRVAVSSGNGPGLSSYRLGQRSGVESNHLTTLQLPAHNHAANVGFPISEDDATTAETGSGVILANTDGAKIYGANADAIDYTGSKINVTVGNTGSNQPINNIQPYLVINYLIALQGIFPSRN